MADHRLNRPAAGTNLVEPSNLDQVAFKLPQPTDGQTSRTVAAYLNRPLSRISAVEPPGELPGGEEIEQMSQVPPFGQISKKRTKSLKNKVKIISQIISEMALGGQSPQIVQPLKIVS